MIKIQKNFSLICLLFCLQFSFSQNTKTKIFLIDALNLIEKTNNVYFNYSNDVIKDIRVNKPKKNLKTQLLLEKLFSETNLKFTLLKDGQIIIFKREESEKITILDEIISARINHTSEHLENIKYGHRLSMSAENIAGAFLEEPLG